LYVDPYALHISSQDWLRVCGNNVVLYFEKLIEKIRDKDQRAVLQLLDNFHEPNETHLGQSSGRPSGRGWGREQAEKLHRVLKNSNVIKTGNLSDLGDFEMFIPGIGPDKISDLATNVSKNELIAYTGEQCVLHGIPVESVSGGKLWDSAASDFISRYVDLPLCLSGPIILVPKTAVRTQLLPDRDKFYSRFVLDYLESEHLSANDSLVKVLKTGVKKIYRKDLKEKHPFTPEQIYEFSQKHPEILKHYKSTLPAQVKPISDLDIEWRQQDQRSLEITDLESQLGAIKPGRDGANAYHNLIQGVLSSIFYPQLTRPVKEQPADDGRKRIDIKFDNSADTGFFSHLVNRQKIFAPYISVECKNYSQDPENPEFDQLKGRFSRKRGNFGLLLCRTIDNPDLLLRRCKDVVNNSDGIIIVLEDLDVLALSKMRSAQYQKGIDEFMADKLSQILF
jgi:hypothetical protein